MEFVIPCKTLVKLSPAMVLKTNNVAKELYSRSRGWKTECEQPLLIALATFTKCCGEEMNI